MEIKLEMFCSLSTNQTWQAWLFHNSNAHYHELISHLKSSRGCASNKEKMVSIFNAIVSDNNLRDSLYSFIRDKFPYIIAQDKKQPSNSPSTVTDIFPNYNPNLITLPRRMILHTDDKNAIDEFVKDKGKNEVYSRDGKTYIEYMPTNIPPSIVASVPDENWLLRKMKRTNK